MASEREMEKEKLEHFRETMDRLTVASHVKTEYFGEHQKIEGYYEEVLNGRFFKCDRLMKQDNMFGTIQLGYNPNRRRVFLFANLKTSRYDTVASRYQKEMKDYQRRSILKGDNENRAYVSKRKQNAVVLIEKKEPKPWTEHSVKTYLRRANMEAAQKLMPFFSKEEENEELKKLRQERKQIQEDIRNIIKEQMPVEDQEKAAEARREHEREIQKLRKAAVEDMTKENLLEAILIRKNTAARAFVRRINYAYDFQKKDIEDYYREKHRMLRMTEEHVDEEEDMPEDED